MRFFTRRFLAHFGRQEWLRMGIRYRIIHHFCPSSGRDDIPFEIDFFGLRFRGNLNLMLDWYIYFFGAYAREELDFMRDCLSKIHGPVVVDVGANVGNHSLFASTIAHQVHAFEPFGPLILRLKDAVALNHLTNLTIHEIGLGDTDESIPYMAPDSGNLGAGSFAYLKAGTETINLQIHVGDEYFQRIGVERIDFLKIDVEGYEIEVLRGMSRTLGMQRPVCLLEWTQAPIRGPQSSGRDLFPADYTFFKFQINLPFLIFFRRERYRLVECGDFWEKGNIVAVPNESLLLVNATGRFVF